MAESFTFDAHDLADTERLGRHLAAVLTPGAVVSLVGPLGAGKTHLVQALAAGLGVPNRRAVCSPTFVLIHEYEGRLPLYHFDTYRLRNPEEFFDLGAAEYFAGDGVCLIEWGDRVEQLLPADHLRVVITATGETSRRFVLTGTGEKSGEIVRQLAARLAADQA